MNRRKAKKKTINLTRINRKSFLHFLHVSSTIKKTLEDVFMLLMDKYADKIYGTITCYDRMIIQGYIPGWSHAEGMTGYLNANNIRIFDFANFSQPLTEQVRTNAQRIADENGIEIEFIRKLRAFRKDDRIQEIIQKTGKTEGLVHIFSAMEQCNTYNLNSALNYNEEGTGTFILNALKIAL